MRISTLQEHIIMPKIVWIGIANFRDAVSFIFSAICSNVRHDFYDWLSSTAIKSCKIVSSSSLAQLMQMYHKMLLICIMNTEKGNICVENVQKVKVA